LSDQPPPKRPTRATVYAPFLLGESLGKPFWETAYLTPRFPAGIKGSDLVQADEAIQRETMAVWYLANVVPATGTYFGFAGPQPEQGSALLNTSRLNTFTLNSIPRVGNFGHGTFFDGGRAPELLRAEFGDNVTVDAISAVATVFEGLWEWKQEQPVPTYATGEDLRTAIAKALDAYEAQFRAMVPEHGGLGHNEPPDDEPVTAEEKMVVLKAVSNLRMAVSSGSDVSVLEAVWSGAAGIAAKLGSWMLNQIGTFFDTFTPAAGKAFGKKSPYLLMAAVGVYYEGLHITDLITMLLKLK
jgi:hypothetical protein